MWNKIFKSKSKKSSSSGSNGKVKTGSGGGVVSDKTGDIGGTKINSGSSHKSKFSIVVNTFTLKRSSKENNNNNNNTTKEEFQDIFGPVELITDTAEKENDNLPNVDVSDGQQNQPIKLDLEPCSICARTFVPATLAKHVKICEKMAVKKRKKFDSSRQRREGTDLADFLPINFGLPQPKQEPKLSPKAVQAPVPVQQKKLEEIIKPQVVTQRKSLSPCAPLNVNSKERTSRAASKRSLGPQTERCPHCERHFGMKAYDRHVEWCKEKNRISNSQKNATLTLATERLQARTQYRAPCVKTRRQANREKYSGLSCGESMNSLSDGCGGGSKSKSNSEERERERKMSMSTSMSSSIMSDRRRNEEFNDDDEINCSEFITDEDTVEDPCAAGDFRYDNDHEELLELEDEKLFKKNKKESIKVDKVEYIDIAPPSKTLEPFIKIQKDEKIFKKNKKETKKVDKVEYVDIAPPPKTLEPFIKIPNRDERTFLENNLTQFMQDTPSLKTKFSKIPVLSANSVIPLNDINVNNQNIELCVTSCSVLQDLDKNRNRKPSHIYLTDDDEDDEDLQTYGNKSTSSDAMTMMTQSRTQVFPNDHQDNTKVSQAYAPNRKTSLSSSKNSKLKLAAIGSRASMGNEDVLVAKPRKNREIQNQSFKKNQNMTKDKLNLKTYNKIMNDSNNDISSIMTPTNKKKTLNQSVSKILSNTNNNIVKPMAKKNRNLPPIKKKTKNITLDNIVEPIQIISDEDQKLDVKLKNSKYSKLFSRNQNHDTNFSISENSSKDGSFEPKPNPWSSHSFCISSDDKSGLSDKYDPFLSAKRQLEELCSPTMTLPSNLSQITPNNKKPKYTSTPLSSSTYSTNPKVALSNAKSNFRRTSSLRVPRKTTISRPIFIAPTKHKPSTIQRGISDEGPISSSFLKPEEYDEMPVKSVCVNDFSTHNSPRVIKRDSSTNLNRRNLKLNLNKTNERSNETALSKTDSLAVFLKYENEAKSFNKPTAFTEKDLKDKSNSLSKQTSLKNSSHDLHSMFGEKEKLASLKNSLTNLMEGNSSANDMSKKSDSSHNILNMTKSYPIKLEPLPKISTPMPYSPFPAGSGASNNSNTLNFNPILDSSKDNDYIDPKLINVCDNLPINITKLSDSDLTSSSTDSAGTTKFLNESQTNQIQMQQQQTQQQHQQQHQYPSQSTSNRNSSDKRNLLKRKIRLGKNQFLYDMSPDSDPYSEQCDKIISIIESDSNKLKNFVMDEPPVFDDFDFEEFISSFEDDEQFPIFKDYKEYLSNRSVNKRSTNLNININHTNNNNNNNNNNSDRSPNILSPDYKMNINDDEYKDTDHEKNHNLSPESPRTFNRRDNGEDEEEEEEEEEDDDHNQSYTVTTPTSPDNIESTDQFGEIKEDIIEIIESSTDINKNNMKNMISHMDHDFVHSVQNLDRMCGSSASMYPIDSDELSSVECFPLRRGVKSKQSADSAYGSLSRHSPIDRSIRRNPSRNRQQINAVPDLHLTKQSKNLQKTENKVRSRDLSASSSGSDASLPPIQLQQIIDKQQQQQQQQQQQLDALSSKMSKFCHECGSKFLVSQAKFCMECGVRRIFLE